MTTVSKLNSSVGAAGEEMAAAYQNDLEVDLCFDTRARAQSEVMSATAANSAPTNEQRYQAVLRISEALSECREHDEVARVLADCLSEFLQFEHLDFVVFKENSREIESISWGKGPVVLPSIPVEDLPFWSVYNSQEALHIADWDNDDQFPSLKRFALEMGIRVGSVIRVPLTTPHRRLGTFGIASAPGLNYSKEDVELMRLIARVVAFALDDGLNIKRAERQTERVQLLLDLSNQITSNLDLRDLLRAVTASIRKVMQCDAVGISLPDAESDKFKLYVLDFPGSKGHVSEGITVSHPAGAPARRALETMKPVVIDTLDALPADLREIALAEGIKSNCYIPLANRGRLLGLLSVCRRESSFSEDEVDFLHHASGQIAIAVENALAYRETSDLRDKLAQEKLYLEEEIRSELGFEQIIGQSAALKRVLELVDTVAASDSTVLLLGETGTGKELIARAVHEHSRRKGRTFVKMNCAAIPTGLLESELFGHEKGAFTGAISQKLGRLELADQGTLFLDEVGDIPTEIQPKLLRALQEREFERLGSTHTRKVNIRVVAATNRDLEQMIKDREFRSDLYYRLKVFPIRIPPLRERREDIPPLVSFFVQKYAKQVQKKIEAIPSAVMKGITAWDWPGNIRELENFIERAVLLTRGTSLEAPIGELRRSYVEELKPEAAQQPTEDIARILKETLEALEGRRGPADQRTHKQREEIIRVLSETKGRVGGTGGAAARIGINRTTLLSRMKRFGIDPRQFA